LTRHIPAPDLRTSNRRFYGTANTGMTLIQADGRHELELPNPVMQGDDSDPFPGSKGQTELQDTGPKATSSFP
jgi:hypothetical protein